MAGNFSFSRFLGNRRGNFSVMAAVLLPTGLGLAGVAIDTSVMISAKASLQNAADAAALAASTALVSENASESEAKELAIKFIAGQMANHGSVEIAAKTPFDFADCTDIKVNQLASIGTAKNFTVEVNTCYQVNFTALSVLFGQSGTLVHVKSTTQASTESKNALSMYLVLDRSGSMSDYTDTVKNTYVCGRASRPRTCYHYYTKIEALQIAATNLMTQLSTSDPTTQYVRTGGVSYNAEMQPPSELAWGENATKSYIAALTSTGGTDSSHAFKTAYLALMDPMEAAEHKARNGKAGANYIVFMTDGDNNYTIADTQTRQWCDEARKARIEVYSVAFMAPERGQSLLNYCATSAAHYFATDDADQLNSAFRHIGEQATMAASRLTH